MTDTAKTTETAAAKKAAKSAVETVESAAVDAAHNARELAETSIERMRATYEQFKDQAQDAVDLFDGSAEAFKSGSADLNAKAIEYAQANINAGFDFARKAVAAKDVTELFKLQSDFAQGQLKAYAEQVQDLSKRSTKLAEDTSKPISEGVMKSFEHARQAFTNA